MTTGQAKARSNMRSALAGASALVVVALVLGADLKAARPLVRDLQRDNVVDRSAARHLTATLARAVRELVGQQSEQPAIHAAPGLDLGPVDSVRVFARAGPETGARVLNLVRPALLNLPPPFNG
jgi:hypothetical protein